MIALRATLLLLAALSAFGADQAWTKVRALKSGTELRIFRRGTTKPVMAKLDDATDNNLIVVTKDEQQAIPKDQIDRIDYRPAGSRVTKETRVTNDAPSDPEVGPKSSGSTTMGSGHGHTMRCCRLRG